MMSRIPWWVVALAVVLALPAGSTPWLVGQAGVAATESKALLWLYPIYLVVSAVLACVCWGERPWLSWILFVLMALSTAGIFALVLV